MIKVIFLNLFNKAVQSGLYIMHFTHPPPKKKKHFSPSDIDVTGRGNGNDYQLGPYA